MKTTKGGKVMNPTDAYRKELRKKELKRNKKERKKVREVGILKKDPETIKEQIDKLEMMKADGALDKARKHKKRQLEDTLNLVLKKRKEYEDKLREKGEAPVMFSHLGPPRRRTTTEEEERAKHPKPEDSVYYHPTLNPTGAPPPGKPPMFKSSIGPRIPLPSSSTGASSSKSESDEGPSVVPPPPPPPPPPLPESDINTSTKDSSLPSTIPLPPPPPIPTKPPADTSTSLPLPHPGLPPKELVSAHGPLPPPPPPPAQRPLQPPPPSTRVVEDKKSAPLEGSTPKESNEVATILPPPPPPPGLPPKGANRQDEATASDSSGSGSIGTNDISKMSSFVLPPPRQPFPVPSGLPLMPPFRPDMVPPGVACFPPPPPDMRPILPAPGLPNRPPPPPPPGMVAPPMAIPPFGAPPGSLASGGLMSSLPSFQEEDFAAYKPSAPQKPSYVKSAASTVVKKPLAQHTPELTAMVPASVRVRRETAGQKAKPRVPTSITTAASRPSAPVTIGKAETTSASTAPKAQSIDDSYMAFLEDMKALGALEN